MVKIFKIEIMEDGTAVNSCFVFLFQRETSFLPPWEYRNYSVKN